MSGVSHDSRRALPPDDRQQHPKRELRPPLGVAVWDPAGAPGLGQRGQLTPAWWGARNSRYGVLKEWRVTESGSFVDGLRLSGVTIADLELGARPYVEVAIGVEANARHVGGLDLFGRGFGNYPQDLVLRLRHRADGVEEEKA